MTTIEKINELAVAMQPRLVEQRRDFHKYAESGWFEMRTSSIIARKLTDLGYEVLTGEDVCDRDARMGVPSEEALEAHYQKALSQGADPEFLQRTKGGMTGVIGILRCGEGPTMAMRFDIDALGVFESEDPDHFPRKEGFASVNEGWMHACGHDGHATMGLGVAEVLMAIKDQLHGTVKLIFQPAEEGVRGAKSIVEKGHLDGVQYFLGSHMTKKLENDPEAQIIPGCYGALATCKYDVVYTGKAAHAGGAPHAGNNALLAAASAVLNLNAIPRHGKGPSRINVGTLVAGSGRNVIADEAKMQIELRGQTTEINDYMCEYATRILENCAAMYGCTCQIKLMGASISFESTESMAQRVADCAVKAGLTPSKEIMFKSGGSEDVAYMVNRVQEQGGEASFMRVASDFDGPAHNRRYNYAEYALSNGVRAFCSVVLDVLGK